MIENLNEMIIKNEPLIYSIINKYRAYFDKDDLLAVGRIALLNAYKNYDKNSNTKFSSYAYFYILGEVNKFIRESNFFKVSKEYAKINKKVLKAKELLTQKLCKEVTDEEVAAFLELDVNIIKEAKSINTIVKSLDKENDDLNLYDTYGYQEKAYNPEIMDLKEELNRLDPLSRKIINERYELGNSQKTTSDNLGLTQVMVSRKERQILTRLRTRLR